ncbi:MAG TPA: thiamine phosphate synthase [Allosphingosinicella sp.]
MRSRQPLPDTWLMTDERLGDGLLAAVGRLPPGAGIVFRHYSLGPAERLAQFERVRAASSGRDLMLLLAGPAAVARAWGADGSHGRGRGPGLRSGPAHDQKEIRAAEKAGADLVFLSPVFATRSHPGARPLGRVQFGLLARATSLPVIALGGMDAARGESLRALGAYGWAGIDAWTNVGN